MIRDFPMYDPALHGNIENWSKELVLKLQQFSEEQEARADLSTDFHVNLSGAVARTIGPNPPVFAQVVDDGAGSTGVYAWAFDTVKLRELFFSIQMPLTTVRNAIMIPHVHAAPINGNAGVVRWGLEYSFASLGTALPTTTFAVVDWTVPGVTLEHNEVFFPQVTGNSNPDGVSLCRLFRDPLHANDTYAGTVYLFAIAFDVRIYVDPQTASRTG